MADLRTRYMGLELPNPVIVGSSRLTSSVDKVVECEQAGAGAVVLKSLFEEQIQSDANAMLSHVDEGQYSQAYDYLTRSANHHYMDDYFGLVEEAKRQVSIPVIASMNCITAGNWIDYAKRFESVGADALELNIFVLPADVGVRGEQTEKVYLDICRKVRSKVQIPFSLKIGHHFSGLANIIKRFAEEGASGMVLFNRFYQPDVDVRNLRLVPAPVLSAPEEIGLPLRWIALLSGEVECDFSAATGVHDGKAVVKQLLVGARTVQLCSTLYRNGVGYIGRVLEEVRSWMNEAGFERVSDFNGKLCQEASDKPAEYERAQYVKALVGIS